MKVRRASVAQTLPVWEVVWHSLWKRSRETPKRFCVLFQPQLRSQATGLEELTYRSVMLIWEVCQCEREAAWGETPKIFCVSFRSQQSRLDLRQESHLAVNVNVNVSDDALSVWERSWEIPKIFCISFQSRQKTGNFWTWERNYN